MKPILTTLISAALAIGTTSSAEEAMAKEVTLTGSATCAKCDLGTAEQCTTVLQVKEGDTTTTYYLEGKADKEWHKHICKGAKDAKVTGTVTEKDGKKIFTATAIELTGMADMKGMK